MLKEKIAKEGDTQTGCVQNEAHQRQQGYDGDVRRRPDGELVVPRRAMDARRSAPLCKGLRKHATAGYSPRGEDERQTREDNIKEE